MAHHEYQSCISACDLCAAACDHCATACLAESDIAPLAQCIRLDLDCAAICRLASGYMARDSALVSEICRLCAAVCDECRQECERHEHDHCRECAEACRVCAEECRRMAA